RKEWRVLVMQPLSRLHGHAAARVLGKQARRATEAARSTQADLTPTHPSALPAASPVVGQASRVSRDPQCTSPSATVRAPRLPAIGQRGEKATAPRIAPTAIPLIGVSCFGHEGLPDGLPPSEP